MNTLRLQEILKSRGFNPGVVDGQMGPRTIAAIKAFQTSLGLKADGIVGPITLAALGAAPASSTALRVSTAGIDLIKAWEGLGDGNKLTVNLEPYVDPVGIWTLGWGHALTDARGKFIRTRPEAEAWMLRMFGKPAITRDEAKALLAMDVNEFLEDLAPVLAGMPTNQGQLDAITALAFNIGVRGFSGSTVLARHKAGVPVSTRFDYEALKAASRSGRTAGPTEYAFAAWAKAGGSWMLGLFRRRVSEALVYGGAEHMAAVRIAQALQ